MVGGKHNGIRVGLWAAFCGWWDTQPRRTHGNFRLFFVVGGTRNHGDRVGALGGFLWLVGNTTTEITWKL
jgi:hypothetical protein